MYSRGIECIDSIADTSNIRNHLEDSRLFKTNKIMSTYHQSWIVDINLVECFQEDFSRLDKIERRVLDPTKRTLRKKFNEHVDEMLDSFSLESTMQKLNVSKVTKKELE